MIQLLDRFLYSFLIQLCLFQEGRAFGDFGFIGFGFSLIPMSAGLFQEKLVGIVKLFQVLVAAAGFGEHNFGARLVLEPFFILGLVLIKLLLCVPKLNFQGFQLLGIDFGLGFFEVALYFFALKFDKFLLPLFPLSPVVLAHH